MGSPSPLLPRPHLPQTPSPQAALAYIAALLLETLSGDMSKVKDPPEIPAV